MKNTVTV